MSHTYAILIVNMIFWGVILNTVPVMVMVVLVGVVVVVFGVILIVVVVFGVILIAVVVTIANLSHTYAI
ncbi:MAG: hypothetical protein AAF125_23110, partial [Chloroflexota bacterium]